MKLGTLIVAIFTLIAVWILSLTWVVYGAEVYGPYKAQVVDVYDGDTFTALVWLWPDDPKYTRVRINGIDAPEIRSKSDCEKRMAVESREYLKKLIDGTTVEIRNVRRGMYYGRVIADVTTEKGESVLQRMVNSFMARVYTGGKREPWCKDR